MLRSIAQQSDFKKWWWPLFAYCVDMFVCSRHGICTMQQSLPLMNPSTSRRSIAWVYLAQGPRHVIIGRPRGFASSANRVPEQIRFDRLDHLVQPWATQLKCACCGMKTKHRCSKCKVGIHDRCFIQLHTTWSVWCCACFFLVLNVMNVCSSCFITVKLELLISNVLYCYFWRPNDWQYYLKAQYVTNVLHIINVCPKEFMSLNKNVFFSE